MISVFPLPRAPCKSMCETMVEKCGPLGIPLPNCSDTSLFIEGLIINY